MSIGPAPSGAPEWDLADRMRKALRTSGLGVQQMAEYLGVDRSTVSTWINGRITPGQQTIRLWAMRTGVSYEWLRTGHIPSRPVPPTTGRSDNSSRTVCNIFASGDAVHVRGVSEGSGRATRPAVTPAAA